MKRRSFLRTVAASAGVVGSQAYVPRPVAAGMLTDEVVDGMPRRALGRTGLQVSIIGYPGFALREEGRSQQEYTESIRHALEHGVNYFDVAPAYANTLCEQRMGKAFAEIKEFQRESIVLACKTRERTKAAARRELEDSLRFLKTDYFDLYQLHCLIKADDDVERSFASDGAMEAIWEAREQGKIRHIGFSAHTTSAALAALNRFDFDTVMFPINYVEMYTFGFGKQVLELSAQKGAAVLAIKPMSSGVWPESMTQEERPRKWWYRTLEDQEEINLALRFTLSQQAVVSGLPPAWMDLTRRAITAGHQHRAMSPEDESTLREMAAQSGSVFRERQQVARYDWDGTECPFGPHEQCPGMIG